MVYGILYTLVLKENENEIETKKYSSISPFLLVSQMDGIATQLGLSSIGWKLCIFPHLWLVD